MATHRRQHRINRHRSSHAIRLARLRTSRPPPTSLMAAANAHLSARFTLGMLWGWIPCGLVYAIAAAAAISGSATTGAILLLGFGIGTLPALLGGSVFMGNGIRKLSSSAVTRPLLAVSILSMSVWQLAAAASQIQ